MLSDKFEALKINEPEDKRAEFERKIYTLKEEGSYLHSFYDFEKPQEITCFSVDKDEQLWFDDRELRYYCRPTSRDLNVGYEQAILPDATKAIHLDSLLDALTDLRNNTNQEHKADIVTWRGIIAKILCTPYTRKEPWEFRATRYNGMIFIEEQTTDEKRKYESEASDREKLMSFWGYKFESLCSVKNPPNEVVDQDLQERLTAVVNTNAIYCTVVKSKLGKNSIIMGAEIDCCQDKKPSDPFKKCSNYMELKTSKIIETTKHQYVFDRYKLLKFWAQSTLVNVPTIICGFRDNEGQIDYLEEIHTQEIPRLLLRKRNMWRHSVCLSFANEVLDWIIANITKDDATITYSIKFEEPYQEITIECTDHSDVFLTQRFIDGTTLNRVGGPRVQLDTNRAN